MKTSILCFFMVIIAAIPVQSQVVHTITADGLVYTPANLTINLGESVTFNVGATHPTLQVNEATYTANGVTPLENGFDFSTGTGTITPTETGIIYYVCTAHISNGMKGKITVVVATGLDDISSSDKYALYPMPLTGNILTISARDLQSKEMELLIYDVAGNLRISARGEANGGKYQLDCSSLPDGLYLMKLKTADGYSYAKLVRN